MQVDAPSLEAAFISTLRTAPLEKFNQLICGYEHSKRLEDLDTCWALTEWYLEDAGYEKIGEHRWRKEHGIDSPSDGNAGLDPKKEKVVQTSTHSTGNAKCILKTDSTAPLVRAGKQHDKVRKKLKRQVSKKLEKPVINVTRKIEVTRTPKEWAEVLAKAKANK